MDQDEVIVRAYEIGLELRKQWQLAFEPEELSEIFSRHYKSEMPFKRFGFDSLAALLENSSGFFERYPGTSDFCCIEKENYEYQYEFPPPRGFYRVDYDSEDELHDVIDRAYRIGLRLHENAKPSFSPEEISEIYSSIYGEPIPHERLLFRTLAEIFEENQHRFTFCEETKGFKCRPVETPRSAVQKKKPEHEAQHRQEEEPNPEEKDKKLKEQDAKLEEGEIRASEESYDSDESIRALQIAIKKSQKRTRVSDPGPPRFVVSPLRRLSLSPPPRKRKRSSRNNWRRRCSPIRRRRSRSRSRFRNSSPSSSPRRRKRRESFSPSPRRNRCRRSRSSGRTTNSSLSRSRSPESRSRSSSPKLWARKRSGSHNETKNSSRSPSREKSKSRSSSPKRWPRKSAGSENPTQPSSPALKRRSCSPSPKRGRSRQSMMSEQIRAIPTAIASEVVMETAKSLLQSSTSPSVGLKKEVPVDDVGRIVATPPCPPKQSISNPSFWESDMIIPPPPVPPDFSLNQLKSSTTVASTPKNASSAKEACLLPFLPPPSISWTREQLPIPQTLNVPIPPQPLTFSLPTSEYAAVAWSHEQPSLVLPTTQEQNPFIPPPVLPLTSAGKKLSLRPTMEQIWSSRPSPPTTPPPQGPVAREEFVSVGLSAPHLQNGQQYSIAPPGFPWLLHPYQPHPSFLTPSSTKKAAFENISQKVQCVLASMRGQGPLHTVESVYYQNFGSFLQNDIACLVPYESPPEILAQISCGEIIVFRAPNDSIFLRLKNVTW